MNEHDRDEEGHDTFSKSFARIKMGYNFGLWPSLFLYFHVSAFFLFFSLFIPLGLNVTFNIGIMNFGLGGFLPYSLIVLEGGLG